MPELGLVLPAMPEEKPSGHSGDIETALDWAKHAQPGSFGAALYGEIERLEALVADRYAAGYKQGTTDSNIGRDW